MIVPAYGKSYRRWRATFWLLAKTIAAVGGAAGLLVALAWCWSAFRLRSVAMSWPAEEVLVLVDGNGTLADEPSVKRIPHLSDPQHPALRSTLEWWPEVKQLATYRDVSDRLATLRHVSAVGDPLLYAEFPVLFAGWLTAPNGHEQFVVCYLVTDYSGQVGFDFEIHVAAFSTAEFSLSDWGLTPPLIMPRGEPAFRIVPELFPPHLLSSLRVFSAVRDANRADLILFRVEQQGQILSEASVLPGGDLDWRREGWKPVNHMIFCTLREDGTVQVQLDDGSRELTAGRSRTVRRSTGDPVGEEQ